MEGEFGKLSMLDIKKAPKDGSKIILIWVTPLNDNNSFDIREGWWEDFSYLPRERQVKLTACWQYVTDRNSIQRVESDQDKVIGWLPLPDISHT